MLLLIGMILVGGAESAEVFDGESIQAAINNATSGETINIHPGNYIENLRITTGNISLVGTDVFLIADVESAPGIWIQAMNVNISGMDISGSWWGILIDKVWFGRIENNKIHNNKVNIEIRDACWTEIRNNTLRNASEDGMYTIRSSYMEIRNNTVRNNSGLGGIFVSMGGFNEIKDNSVHGNRCRDGGITVYSSMYNEVARNHVYNNTEYGISLVWGNNNWIYGNVCADGCDSYSSKNNTWNLDKTNEQNIVGGNSSGGNYWGDYPGIDEDGDGIGDTPFYVPGCMDEDAFPLVAPKCGDCDWNGYVSANDVVEAYRKAVNPDHKLQRDWAADVDGNNYISAGDVVEIYRKAVNPMYRLNCFPMT